MEKEKSLEFDVLFSEFKNKEISKKNIEINYFEKEDNFIDIFSNNEKRAEYVKEIEKEVSNLKLNWKQSKEAEVTNEITKKLTKSTKREKWFIYILFLTPFIISLYRDMTQIHVPQGFFSIIVGLLIFFWVSIEVYLKIKLENEKEKIFIDWFNLQNKKYSLSEYAAMDKNKTVLGLKLLLKNFTEMKDNKIITKYIAPKIVEKID